MSYVKIEQKRGFEVTISYSFKKIFKKFLRREEYRKLKEKAKNEKNS
ncbi:MAG: hypothetical protein GTN36_04360 [Candidatus Aenigmarchaeota archaeon]|nr:hypothetical protein [Candidatus Aenigmarchaeota archaeon]